MTDGLRALKTTGRKLVALSNSSRTLVEQQLLLLLTGAGLRPFFDEVLSVETLATYKPDLAVYQWRVRASVCIHWRHRRTCWWATCASLPFSLRADRRHGEKKTA
uniref:hypothetical protein n=1 Tax=Salmonella enterica TaxID=28901 RepID=UPI001B35732B|nr:hypothetical protein [Salmonella enterica]